MCNSLKLIINISLTLVRVLKSSVIFAWNFSLLMSENILAFNCNRRDSYRTYNSPGLIIFLMQTMILNFFSTQNIFLQITTATTPLLPPNHHCHTTAIASQSPLPQHRECLPITTATTPRLPPNHHCHNTAIASKSPLPQHRDCLQITDTRGSQKC